MDALFFNPDPLTVMSRSLPEHNITDVLDAITSRRYPAFYAALRKYQHLFSPEGAFLLIQQALEYELTIHAFLSILKRCPPVEEFLFSSQADTPFLGIHGLVELAAYLNRTDVLALLLERGGNVNRFPAFSLSPLEAALEGTALGSVELLVQQPELDTAWTPRLLSFWSCQDPEPPKLEFCIQAVAPRFFPETYSLHAPLPIPDAPEMTALAIRNENWLLARRLLHERPPRSQKEIRSILTAFQSLNQQTDQPNCVSTLIALLEVRPGLLRRRDACQVLLRYWLLFSPPCLSPLQPWVERIPFSHMELSPSDWLDAGAYQVLPLWRDRLPNGPALAVNRWSPIFQMMAFDEDPFPITQSCGRPRIPSELLSELVSCCPILGKAKPNSLSPLAEAMLQRGRPEQLESLLLPGGALADEPPQLLLDRTQDESLPRHNRAVILALIRKEETYDL
ncbi:MAG: hypothetical protein HFF53_09835 [Lawsonibacter sp.]|nr:hypothetical protein [Lawsonibacter sp.]